MAKPGPKEQKLQQMRESAADAEQEPPPAAAEEGENVRKPKKKGGAKAARKPAGPAKAKAKIDRSPKTVGDFIVAAGEAGVAMADIEKKFKMDAHPLRAKIYSARHDLGYDIKYVAETKHYVGKAPPAKEAA